MIEKKDPAGGAGQKNKKLEYVKNIPETAANVNGGAGELAQNIIKTILADAAPLMAEKPINSYGPSDIDQCRAFCEYFSRWVKYNKSFGFAACFRGLWLYGEVGEAVTAGLVQRLALQRYDLREVSDEPDFKRYAKDAVTAGAVSRMIEMLKKAAKLKAMPDEFNRRKYMLACKDRAGRVKAANLKTGEIRDAAPEDMLSMSANYAPTGGIETARERCPVFIKFMRDITLSRLELAEYLMAYLGYSITGEMREHTALFLSGLTGGNGKTTLINLLKSLLGDYIIELPESVIFNTKNDGRFDLYRLAGARLAVKSDIPAGASINIGNFKNITGGDAALQAERKFHDPFAFTPECKLILCCNRKPRLPETGGAMERRIALAPFEADFRKNPDKNILEKMLAEGEAIMALLVSYAVKYYAKGGLPKCGIIEAGAREYLYDEDLISQFIAEKCEAVEGAFTLKNELEAAAAEYAGKSVSRRAIKDQLEAKGYRLIQLGAGDMRGKRGYENIILRA